MAGGGDSSGTAPASGSCWGRVTATAHSRDTRTGHRDTWTQGQDTETQTQRHMDTGTGHRDTQQGTQGQDTQTQGQRDRTQGHTDTTQGHRYTQTHGQDTGHTDTWTHRHRDRDTPELPPDPPRHQNVATTPPGSQLNHWEWIPESELLTGVSGVTKE